MVARTGQAFADRIDRPTNSAPSNRGAAIFMPPTYTRGAATFMPPSSQGTQDTEEGELVK
jgi:hypothetical protein